MTCVLSPAQPFSLTGGWSVMNTAGDAATSSNLDLQQYVLPTSEPESVQSSGSSSRKRASRAGTRSVSTLSAAQLDRKRANDREAQRAIRQRTKDHIDSLESSINELRAAKEAAEKTLTETRQRNQELEDENAFLRARLNGSGAGYAAGAALGPDTAEPARSSVRSNSSATHASATSVQAADSAALSRGHPHSATQQLSHQQPAFWQPPQNELVQVQTAPAILQDPKTMHVGRDLTSWRPHDGVQSVGSVPDAVHDGLQGQGHAAAAAYNATAVAQYPQWTTSPVHGYAAQNLTIKTETPPPPRDRHYSQPGAGLYQPQVGPHQNVYQSAVIPAPAPPPQQQQQQQQQPAPAAYQTVDASNAIVYQPQHAYAQVPQYQIQPHPVQMDPQASNVPPAAPAVPYDPSQAPPQYHHPQMQPAVAYRTDAAGNTYPMPHYPSG